MGFILMSLPAPNMTLTSAAPRFLLTLASTIVPLPLLSQSGAPTLVIYSSRSHYGAEAVFDAFTRATGITLEFFSGGNNEVIERLRAEGSRTRADVLLTVDAGNLWFAAQQGLLQPVQSAVLERNLPAHLRDPGNQWFGIAVRARTIMYSTERVDPRTLTDYRSLADPRWRGRLCLRTSTAVYNQSLLASLIAEWGEAAVEQMVRGWVANEPVYINGDTQILEAIAAGRCDVGIANTYYLARLVATQPDFPVAPFWPDALAGGVHVNISGAGVTRFTRQRDAAVRFLEYLSTPEAQTILAGASKEYPANPSCEPDSILRRWGPFAPQRVGVAAAGQYQAAAVRLADRAGYR
jgi:iron(III) transport system substrate-binding protein